MESSTVHFLDLPFEDVVCRKILIFLPVSDICKLKLVSKDMKHLSETYFQICRVIDLSIPGVNSRFTGEHFEIITRESQCLRELNLRMCKKWVHNKYLIPVINRNQCLRKIDISGCLDVTNEAITEIATSCNELEVLALKECRWLSSDALEMLGKECKSLKTLNLNGCWNISNQSLCTVLRNNQSLKNIDIGSCYGIEGDTVGIIAKNCIGIEYLNIKGCWRVKNDAIFLMREYSKSLKELKVEGCTSVTEASLSMLRARGVKIDVKKPVDYRRPAIALGFEGLIPARPLPLYLQI